MKFPDFSLTWNLFLFSKMFSLTVATLIYYKLLPIIGKFIFQKPSLDFFKFPDFSFFLNFPELPYGLTPFSLLASSNINFPQIDIGSN